MVLTNRDLGFTGAHHIVLGFDAQINDHLRFRTETYYQYLFDVPVEYNNNTIKTAQMEMALRNLSHRIAVFYDPAGISKDKISAKLNYKRIPVTLNTGVFHPKNFFLLVETNEENGDKERSLIVGALSANLNSSGWWKNVESFHIEEIGQKDNTVMNESIRNFLDRVLDATPSEGEIESVQTIVHFLENLDQSGNANVINEGNRRYFYDGSIPLHEFLDEKAGELLKNTSLEIISPYFDNTGNMKPLKNIIQKFHPSEIRISLPVNDAGEVRCSEKTFEAVRKMDNAEWGLLPSEVTRLGSSKNAGNRFVHAKVYRFFHQKSSREFILAGSPNLTESAHNSKSNMESGFLVEVINRDTPEFWLEKEEPDKKYSFVEQPENEEEAATVGSRLMIRYDWDKKKASAFWNHDKPFSGELTIRGRGERIGVIRRPPASEWMELPGGFAETLENILTETSFLNVIGERDAPLTILAQEEGMFKKPSQSGNLTPSQIMRLWSQMTPEQKSEVLESCMMQKLIKEKHGSDDISEDIFESEQDNLFAQLSGFFHAFGCLERSLERAFENNNSNNIKHLLFGERWDSVRTLLITTKESEEYNDVDKYLIFLCARQLVNNLKENHENYSRNQRAKDFQEIEDILNEITQFEQNLIEVSGHEDMEEFLLWFKKKFLQKAVIPGEAK